MPIGYLLAVLERTTTLHSRVAPLILPRHVHNVLQPHSENRRSLRSSKKCSRNVPPSPIPTHNRTPSPFPIRLHQNYPLRSTSVPHASRQCLTHTTPRTPYHHPSFSLPFPCHNQNQFCNTPPFDYPHLRIKPITYTHYLQRLAATSIAQCFATHPKAGAKPFRPTIPISDHLRDFYPLRRNTLDTSPPHPQHKIANPSRILLPSG